MSNFQRKLLPLLLALSDLIILITALLAASWVITFNANDITLTEFLSMRFSILNFFGVLGVMLIWHLLFRSARLYRSRRLESSFKEWKDILKVTTFAVSIFTLCGVFFNIEAFTPAFIAIFWLSSTVLAVLFRVLARYALRIMRIYGRNLRFVLIVGTSEKAYDFARRLEEKKENGYKVIGFIDTHVYSSRKDINLIGTLKSFPEVISQQAIDEVVITLPVKSYYDEIQEIIRKAEEQGIVIRYLAEIFDTKIAEARTDKFENHMVLTMTTGSIEGWPYLLKRTTDIILSSAIIIITLPLFVLAAIAIKIDSRGPILFIHKRVGLNKRIFNLYKFRTMIPGAEKMQPELEALNEMDGPVFKIQNDPRITKVGRWLRKTSIDELPQLINILKGDMSLVGPRPFPVRDYNKFSKDWQRRRLSVLPGLTCSWQIKGRNGVAFEDWMKLDMEYIDNWKFSNDLKIIAKTIPSVIKGKGAF